VDTLTDVLAWVRFSQSLLSDALGSIAYLGGVMKKIGSHIGDVNSVEETLKSGGKKLASAWEEAYQFITEDEERQDQPHQPSTETPSTPSKPIREASPSTPSAFPSTPSTAQSSTGAQQRPSLASPTFASLFEAKLGQVHFATLENMSMQASLQLQQIVRKLTEPQRALLTKQQDELRAIYAEDVATTALDLETLKLPGESPSSSREKFQTQLAALHQKLAFYSSRTASLQAFALKAVAECDVPEDGANLKALSEGTLNYRGKMQLEGLRQVSEFCALAVHQILLATEHVKESYETAEDPKSVNLVEHARIIHGLALTTKELVWNISSQIVASMKTLGNSFKSRVPNAQTDPAAQAVVQSTLKRISSGINNLQLDLATAASQILDASRFTLALVQHFEALNASNSTATTESHTSSD
jgi:hypothetical protein